MKAKLVGENLIGIVREDGRLIGELVLHEASYAEKLLEILNDVQDVKSGELRKAVRPLCIEMVAQKIDAIHIDRIGTQMFFKLWKEGAKEWEPGT